MARVTEYAQSCRLFLGSSLVLCATLAWCVLVYAAWEEAAAIRSIPGAEPVRRLGVEAMARVSMKHTAGSAQYSVTLDKPHGEPLGVHLLWDGRTKKARIENIGDTSLVANWNIANPKKRLEIGDLLVAINGVSVEQQSLAAQIRSSDRVTLTLERGMANARKSELVKLEGQFDPQSAVSGKTRSAVKSLDPADTTAKNHSPSATVLPGTKATQQVQTNDDSSPAARFHVVEPPLVDGEFSVVIMKSPGTMLGLHLARERDTIRIVHLEPNSLAAKWNREHPEQTMMPGDLLVGVNGISHDWSIMIAESKKSGSMTFRFKRGKSLGF